MLEQAPDWLRPAFKPGTHAPEPRGELQCAWTTTTQMSCARSNNAAAILGERTSAATGFRRIRIDENEALLHQGFVVIESHAVQINK